MSKTHRIINNAIWFTLFGPLIGLIVAIPTIYIYTGYPYGFFRDIVRELPFVLLITYIWGSLPALATGIIIANLTPLYQKFPFAALVGAITSGLLPTTLLIFWGQLDFEVLGLSILCGTLSSVVMYQAVHYLPALFSPLATNTEQPDSQK